MAELFVVFTLLFWDWGWDGPRGRFLERTAAVEDDRAGTFDGGTPIPPKP
ncbi:MAG TPA: hypothetical protein VII13_16655 [Vicinamibacteria bacterium]|jgi:hypothetical protein